MRKPRHAMWVVSFQGIAHLLVEEQDETENANYFFNTYCGYVSSAPTFLTKRQRPERICRGSCGAEFKRRALVEQARREQARR